MSAISIFEMFSVGIGPSSSHTLGPWRAAIDFKNRLRPNKIDSATINTLTVELYGSLSLTGKGHYTDKAILMGLSGYTYEEAQPDQINEVVESIKTTKKLYLFEQNWIDFDVEKDLIFKSEFLEHHPNALKITIGLEDNNFFEQIYYSLGGGFISTHEDLSQRIEPDYAYHFPINSAKDILQHCELEHLKLSELVLFNESKRYGKDFVDERLLKIYEVMRDCAFTGCHSSGHLPGILKVKRRAFDIHKSLIKDSKYTNAEEWITAIRKTKIYFREILKWVSCFALAVNEENAAMGKVVTAPTNGSAGVVPAVLLYYLTIENHRAGFEEIKRYLAVAAEIGSLFKKNATISAAMGGCQAEIGVSSAMAAAGLTELMGGSPYQVLAAAEIAMEHHLGLTCDPIAGLVQIPCIERNSMGAIKAINASELALSTQSEDIRVSLDQIIATMWETAKDMNSKYKETSTGGLAIQVNVSDC